MIEKLKSLDTFSKNIIIVFAGTSLLNFFNLLYQLLIAHKLSPSDFAEFNALLSIFTIISSSLGTIQLAVAKYSAEFNARGQVAKVKFLLSDLFKKTSVLAILTFLVFWLSSGFITKVLKIPSLNSGYILACLLALCWPTPVLAGAVQGLELFGWLTLASVISGALKLVLAFIAILSGYAISGALGALLASSLIFIAIFYLPLRKFISLSVQKEEIDYKQVVNYLFPVAISTFCYMSLVSMDMILVKYFFKPQDSGIYSLAQMVGKIFLFLPVAISIVMFPRSSGQNAKNLDTFSILKRSLYYASILCIIASLIYNIFPGFIMKVLTGKIFSESVMLGRLFSVSMIFFALLFVLITYFLSIKDLRFIKYLVLFTILEFLAIVLFHSNLIQIQLILSINAISLFIIHLGLAYRKKERI